MADLINGRLFRVVAGTFLAFAIATCFIDAPTMILGLNGMLLSVAGGVMVAYAPVVLEALTAPRPTKADYLGAGIFLVATGLWLNRIISFVARDLGYPDIYNRHPMSFVLVLGILGGLFHLWAPNAVEGRLPRERWVLTGAVVAIGLFAVFIAWTAHARIEGHPLFELR